MVKTLLELPTFALENLEGGKYRQVLTANKPSNLPHKTRTGIVSTSSNFCPATAETYKEDRKVYVRKPAAPVVSMAEMMKKFQSGTREVSSWRSCGSLSQSDVAGAMQRKTKLTLTSPKTPEFTTSQCVHSVKIKSSAEIEEEMMAKIPKFKSFESPTLPPLPRSAPHLPEFKANHSFSASSKTNANHMNVFFTLYRKSIQKQCQGPLIIHKHLLWPRLNAQR